MPHPVAYIECGKVKPGEYQSCDGHLELLAHTSVGGGIQYGDTHDHTYFLVCPKCGQIYFTDYSDPENTEISNFDFAHPGKLVAYDGKLTKEDFAKYAQTISGHFSVFYHEKDLLAKARPYQWSGTGLVRELHNGRWPYCAVEVPKELLGKKVIIQVVEE